MTLPRWVHKFYAHVFGYFWLPCPKCGRYFGGQETGGTLWLTGGTGKIMCRRHPEDITKDEAGRFIPPGFPTSSVYMTQHGWFVLLPEAGMGGKRLIWRWTLYEPGAEVTKRPAYWVHP